MYRLPDPILKLLLAGILLVLSAHAGILRAQGTSPGAREPVFHVYSTLIQIPVLVLNEHHQPLPEKTPLQFAVSIDSGPEFPVKYARIEGNDPIALSILLDMSGDQKSILAQLATAVAALAPQGLRGTDRVSIYAVDCHLVQTASTMWPDAAHLKIAMERALGSTTVHGTGKTHAACGKSLNLRNALMYLISELSKQSGRRVILAITDGHDNGSKHSWKEVKEYANNQGVAIFGLTGLPYDSTQLNINLPPYRGYEDEFNTLCELSGGLLRTTPAATASQSLKTFISLVRNRYIVEFPRPDSLESGMHSFDVTVQNAKEQYFVRSSGISLPIADRALLADPNAAPSDPTKAPVPGNRRMLQPK